MLWPVLILLLCGLIGCISAGFAIAALHRYAHAVKPSTCADTGPKTAAIYVFMHLNHHRTTHVSGYAKETSYNWSNWKQSLKWAIPFAMFDMRWMALQTLFWSRCVMVLVCMLPLLMINVSIMVIAVSAIVFLITQFACLVAYDLCHMWSHAGGPFPSKLHIDHHIKVSGNYGMWTWHNWLGQRNMRFTIWCLRQAEFVASFLPFWRNLLDNNLSIAQREYR